jgi:hypothetical protein
VRENCNENKIHKCEGYLRRKKPEGNYGIAAQSAVTVLRGVPNKIG